MKANSRRGVYLVALGLSVSLGIAVVAGVVTEEAILQVFALAATFFGAFGSLLALINITPDRDLSDE